MHLRFKSKAREDRIILDDVNKLRDLQESNSVNYSEITFHCQSERSSPSEDFFIHFSINQSTNDNCNTRQFCWSGGRNH